MFPKTWICDFEQTGSTLSKRRFRLLRIHANIKDVNCCFPHSSATSYSLSRTSIFFFNKLHLNLIDILFNQFISINGLTIF